MAIITRRDRHMRKDDGRMMACVVRLLHSGGDDTIVDRTRCRCGFSLVEVMVATAMLLVVGGAAGTLLVQAFAIWEHVVTATRSLAAVDDFTTRIARDFASAPGAMGFAGMGGGCRFHTLVVRSDGVPQLQIVEYEIGPQAILRRASASDDPGVGGGLVVPQRFAPVAPVTLLYGGADTPPDEWLAEWHSPTNAPSRLGLRFQEQSGPAAAVRTILRRTP